MFNEALEVPEAIGESFNIGNARVVMTILGLAQTVCRVLNSKSKIVFDPPLSGYSLEDSQRRKAQKILKFKAKVDLDEGIVRTAEWIKNSMIRLAKSYF